jgi:AbrB family looped-hinge helix DNA binding protein
MDASARITSTAQVTIPRSVREALDLREGHEVVFRVADSRAVLAKTPDFLSMPAIQTVAPSTLLRALEVYEVDGLDRIATVSRRAPWVWSRGARTTSDAPSRLIPR